MTTFFKAKSFRLPKAPVKLRLEDIASLPSIDMSYLTFIACEAACMEIGLKWHDTEAVCFTEYGMGVFLIPPEALGYLVGHPQVFGTDYSSDISKLQNFIEEHGNTCIYEIVSI
jgi:hypothetical protein